jgi:hypothetical protein
MAKQPTSAAQIAYTAQSAARASSGVSVKPRPRLRFNEFASALHPQLRTRAASRPYCVLHHGVADADDNEGSATVRTFGRNRDVVLDAVAQQLAALSTIEEHSGLVNSGLGQSVVSGAQS